MPWASYRQRPHEFVDWFHSRLQADVLWIEPYPARLPRWQDVSRPSVRTSHAGSAPHWIQVFKPFALPAEPLAAGRALNRALFWPSVMRRIRTLPKEKRTVLAIGKPSDLALRALQEFPEHLSLYDAMDDFPAFHDGRARSTCANIEEDIVRRATLRSTSSTQLAQRMREVGAGDVHLVPNGVASSRLPAVPRSRRGITPPRDFGYVGTVGPWFDWDWVVRLAQDWPDRKVEIHGPRYLAPPTSLPSNITLEPALAHEQAVLRMAGFAAGLIPFRANALTESVDPVKYYEYRGLGLPVISAPFGEMRRHGSHPRVLLTDDPAACHAAIADLLAGQDTAESMTAFRRHNDWSARFEPLADLLDALP